VIGIPRPRKTPGSMGYGEHGVYGVGEREAVGFVLFRRPRGEGRVSDPMRTRSSAILRDRCRANMAHARQSRLGSGPGCLVEITCVHPFQFPPLRLEVAHKVEHASFIPHEFEGVTWPIFHYIEP